MGRRDQDDRRREFVFPVHKLFAGRQCASGAALSLAFTEYHRNDKLRRVHTAGGVRAIRGFDLGAAPFVRDSTNRGGLVTLRREGASALVVPRHYGAFVRTATQRNSISRRAEIVRFVVPDSSRHERFETSLLLEPPNDARRAPEYVNIRHPVVSKGGRQTVEDMQALPPEEFDRLIEHGGYEAAHFVDDSCDGAVVAVVGGLPRALRTLAAYSLVTAPDFFPLSDLSHDGTRPAKQWRPEGWTNLRPIDGPRGIDVSWTCVRAAAGPGYFLAGDAAFVLDPASSHGMLKALMSGMLARHYAAAIASGAERAEVAAHRYDAWMASWFSADCLELNERYSRFGGGGTSRRFACTEGPSRASS